MSEEVAQMYNMNIGALDLLLCKHNKYLSQCAKCRECMNTMWLLDSGASAHFTNLMSNFISYTPFAKSDRIPVKTASNFILVEGIGTVLLKHYLGRKLVTTRVHPVLYIPDMTTQLLSMGEFLQQGMRVHGDSNQISLWDQIHLFIQCKPLITGQTLYWLDATSIMVETQSADSATINKVDYDLMHRRLGHPSKEVLRGAKDHTKGFPDGILIPTNEGLCPGCAQGKMPAASHPKSDTRATAPFKRIHSDLKSFPLPSYHKYKYFIVFLDDYTSHAWITLLRDKASAITALEQWLALIKNQYDTTIKEWMSDAGGEYKLDAFLKQLKDASITVLHSVPHTPQQNGRAECFMHTIMDKAQAMCLDACLPQSWWEFAVLHAAHCYNRTPISRLEWKTPYELLHNEIPDISHLRVFGCSAYVHIPEACHKNKLSPKSELMIYLGRGSGIKGDVFMCTPNTLFYLDKALFDEIMFPKCSEGHSHGKSCGSTQLGKPPTDQPPNDEDFIIPGDDDDLPPPEPPQKRGGSPNPNPDPPQSKGKGKQPVLPQPTPDPVPGPSQPSTPITPPRRLRRPTTPPRAPSRPVRPTTPRKSGRRDRRPSPPLPAPVPSRRSERLRRQATRPDNVYGDRPPTTIIRDIERDRNWRQLVEDRPGSSRGRRSQDQPMPGGIPEQDVFDPPTPESEDSHSEDEVDQQLLTRLAQEGGVKFLDYLLAAAVAPYDLGSPDTSNIREWTFKDILKMPSDQQEEWRAVCHEELESLHKRKVYELVDPPKGRKVIKNRWVFNIKLDGHRKARLVAKGFSQVEGVNYDEIFLPVVRFETVRMMLTLAALRDWHISGLDVKTAFLYGELDEELYMEQPEGFKIPGQQNKVMLLKHAIYGLKQAALAWWRALDKSMSTLSCTRLQSDAGLFVNKDKTVIIIVYVDNVLFLGKNIIDM